MEVRSILEDACPHVLLPPQTTADAPGSSWPSMWHKWLLDLKQIMNHPQVSVMITDQDKDFLSYMIDLNVSEGGRRQVCMGLGGVCEDHVIHVPTL